MKKNEKKTKTICPEVVESVTYDGLLAAIGDLLHKARANIARHVNDILVQTYWQTGRYIVEYEQHGSDRAKYGDGLINRLLHDLTAREGRGYSKTNILYMRKLYLTFRKGETLSHFLSWSHYMLILENASDALKAEAEALAEKLDYRLGDPLFRSVSRLDRLPLASPALQRREGYREVLRAWLMFESAAKIAWEGGEDVYKGGKRNVAVLYEYWAFFKLLDVVSNVFDFPKNELEKLIVRDKDKLEMSLTGHEAGHGQSRVW